MTKNYSITMKIEVPVDFEELYKRMIEYFGCVNYDNVSYVIDELVGRVANENGIMFENMMGYFGNNAFDDFVKWLEENMAINVDEDDDFDDYDDDVDETNYNPFSGCNEYEDDWI